MQEKTVSSVKWRVSPLSIALIGLFVALSTVGAYVKIPGPLVPFTAQFFFCTIGGVLLGAKRGFAAQCIYLVLGLLGLPLFTGGRRNWVRISAHLRLSDRLCSVGLAGGPALRLADEAKG